MVYNIYYGDIRDEWAEDWSEKNPKGDPFEVLTNDHGIYPPLGSGWFGFHMVADEHFTDRIEIDWGSRAWKCRGQDLIDLHAKGAITVNGIESVDPEKIYGVVFIEMS